MITSKHLFNTATISQLSYLRTFNWKYYKDVFTCYHLMTKLFFLSSFHLTPENNSDTADSSQHPMKDVVKRL